MGKKVTFWVFLFFFFLLFFPVKRFSFSCKGAPWTCGAVSVPCVGGDAGAPPWAAFEGGDWACGWFSSGLAGGGVQPYLPIAW